LSAPTKTAERRERKRRKKDQRKALWQAILVGLLLGIAFAAVVVEPPESQVLSSLPAIFAAASFLVAAGMTDRAWTGFVCGVSTAVCYLVTLLALYTWLWTVLVGLDVMLLEAPRILVCPPAGAAGGYIVRRIL